MTSPYILQFSDPTNVNTITILPVPAGAGIDNYSTSLSLVGPGYRNYGLPVAQNFLKLLENFSGPNKPSNAIKGQLWYDTSNVDRPVLRINNGNTDAGRWPSANGIYQQTVDPIVKYSNNIIEGDIWVDTSTNQLKIRFSNDWTVVGPSVQSGIGKSGTEAVTVESITGDLYPVIKNWSNGHVVEIISYNAFTPRTVIDGFATIKIGTNLTNRGSAKYNGVSERASALEISPGVLIAANRVLTNNATSQTLSGSLDLQSTNGLYIRSNSTNDPIKIYSNLTGGAFIDFQDTTTTGTLKIGINSNSYLRFNSNYSNIGINKPTSSNSPTLDVNGSGGFSGTLIVSSTLTVAGSAIVGNNITTKSLKINGNTTSTGVLTLGTDTGSGAILLPEITGVYDIGSPIKTFGDVYAIGIYANSFYGNVTGSATSLATARSFNIQGQVTATSVLFKGTATSTFNTTLTRYAITDQSTTSTTIPTQTLLVLDTSTNTSSLQQISKLNFLSDIYSNLFTTGMIIPFGTSTNIPSGFLVCDNRSASVSLYPNLYAIIGTSYGNAGSGTFRTPNLATATSMPIGGYLTYIIKT